MCVGESEQEMARMCRIPNFPHGLLLGRKPQLSFRLSVPLIVDQRDGFLQDDLVVHQKNNESTQQLAII